MALEQPPLPYPENALEPHISARTFSFHYGKHHAAYVTNGNSLLKGSPLETAPIEEIIKKSWADKNAGLFNNSAQVWNHTFFWNSMKPSGGGKPTGEIASMIDKAFGSYDAFKEQFKQAGVTQFGSGWAWLVLDGGQLKITKTPNAELPMVHNQTALLTCDVWEHAYYIDYQNRRPDFLQTFIDSLINWDFVNKNLGKSR